MSDLLCGVVLKDDSHSHWALFMNCASQFFERPNVARHISTKRFGCMGVRHLALVSTFQTVEKRIKGNEARSVIHLY